MSKPQTSTVTVAPGYHVPVLLAESVDGLAVRPGGIYVDATFGGGGHSREILRRLEGSGRLFGFDQDADAESNIPPAEPCFTFVRSNFRYLSNWLRYYEVDGVDGILADLGVSSHHFDAENRGFSFRYDAPLDMRMNARAGETAADVLAGYEEERLADLFYLYGELKNARKIAAVIVRARRQRDLRTVSDLTEAVSPLLGREREKKDLAKVFQALRIEVNHEMDALRDLLDAALRALRPGGRLSVLTYHSLEDRIVKNYIRSGNAEGRVEQDFFGRRHCPLRAVGGSKPLIPSPEEQTRNPRSRSAKLRVAEKVADLSEQE
ncbi:MAG: 16S rRNA (cytosine(1402)-N(4))-methyltransferase RsmH [Alloprevotella sp.]